MNESTKEHLYKEGTTDLDSQLIQPTKEAPSAIVRHCRHNESEEALDYCLP
jgi:hypothetical protein